MSLPSPILANGVGADLPVHRGTQLHLGLAEVRNQRRHFDGASVKGATLTHVLTCV